MLKLKLPRHQVTIVVAKYREDVRWTKSLPYRCIVYDKDKDIPNLGLEAETYLRHILENYSDLTDFTLFLQGGPFDHTRTVKKHNIAQKIAKLQFVNAYQPFYPKITATNPRVLEIERKWGPWGRINLGEYADQWFLPPIQKFNCGAQFMVPREAILFRSKKFYEEVIKTTNYQRNVKEAHFLERLWPIIFDGQTEDRITHRKAQ